MGDIVLFVPDRLYPTVKDILIPVLDAREDVDDIWLWYPLVDRSLPVLGLGALPESNSASQIKTLSQKQLMANPAAISEINADLDMLLSPKTWPNLGWNVVDGLDEEQERSLGNQLVVDIETGGNYNKLLNREMRVISVAIHDGVNTYVFTEESLDYSTEDNCLDQLRRILSKRGRKLIAHNMKYDFPALSRLLGVPINGHLDTMVLHYDINPGAKEHGLKHLCQKYLGAPEWEALAKSYTARTHDYSSIPREILYNYNAHDVIWTWRLKDYLLSIAEGDKRLAKLVSFTFLETNFFQNVEYNGVAVNIPYLEELRTEIIASMEESKTNLQKIAWPDFNPNSPMQVKKWFLEHGYKLDSTDEKHLERAYDKFNAKAKDFTDKLLEFRGFSKMYGTYVKGMLLRHRNGIVYPEFKVIGTATGRTSCANPNVQNIPRDKKFRKIIVSRDPENNKLIQCDYSQAELRVMACLSKDEYLISLFQEGSPDFFDALMPSAFPTADIPSWTSQEAKDNRAKLKATIYGLAYNRKAAAIAADLKMPVKEAQAIITNFFKAAPDFYEWRQWVEGMAIAEDQVLISPFGRFYQAEVVTGRNRQNIINSGLSFLPQGTASDLCITAAIEVAKWLHEFPGAMIVATIHDAILLDCPNEYAEEVRNRVQWEMREAGRKIFGDTVVFATDGKIGDHWGEI